LACDEVSNVLKHTNRIQALVKVSFTLRVDRNNLKALLEAGQAHLSDVGGDDKLETTETFAVAIGHLKRIENHPPACVFQ
jgi:hypothetical protein